MKAKLIANNKEIEVEIGKEQLKALETTPKKKTGYERAERGNRFYFTCDLGDTAVMEEDRQAMDNVRYEIANYYSDRTVAENNARADKLLRQLRRFAVEHKSEQYKNICFIRYYEPFKGEGHFEICEHYFQKELGQIYFYNPEIAKLAIDTFYDELMWYFTEYKDSL